MSRAYFQSWHCADLFLRAVKPLRKHALMVMAKGGWKVMWA